MADLDRFERAVRDEEAHECWSEVWNVLQPLFQGVVETGEAFWAKDHRFELERHGYVVLTAEPGREALRLAAIGEEASLLPVPVDFIQKPFSPSALAAKVREMLDRHRSSSVEHT